MSSPLLKDDKFHFFVPVELVKAEDTSIPTDKRRLVQGIASTDDVDLQGERVVQSGLDYSYLLAFGHINDDHKPGPEHIVGEPVDCRITPAGFWLRAMLYKGQERAEYWWNFIKALKENDSKRSVGWSIEGRVIRRNGNKVVRAWLKNVAITASPINTNTYLEIAKALCAEPTCRHPWKSLARSCKGCPGNLSCPVKNDDDESEEKALSASGMGRVLIPQSLEGGVKTTTYKSLPNQLTKSDAIDYLQTQKGYSPVTARAVTNVIFSQNKERPHSGGRNEHDC